MDWSHTLKTPKFWLLAIAAAIAAVHLTLLSRIDNSDIFAMSALFWLATGSLIWDRQDSLELDSQLFPSLIGIGLISLILLRVSATPNTAFAIWMLPLIGLCGLGLLASGFKGLRQYWKELVIFGLLAVYPLLQMSLQAIDLSGLTAMAAAFNLSYLGFPVVRQGVFIMLPPASRVEVYGACSGLQSILQLLCISVLFLLMFPLKHRWQQVVTVIAAIAIAFIVNSFRVSLMAFLNSGNDKNAFDYWHVGQGSLIFSAIAVFLFGLFCWVCFLRTAPPPTPPAPTDSGAQENA